MVFKHLRNLFDSKDKINDFSQLFLVCAYVVIRYIPHRIARSLGVVKLLAFIFQPFHHLSSQLDFVGFVVQLYKGLLCLL
jgi:hypothetical protein